MGALLTLRPHHSEGDIQILGAGRNPKSTCWGEAGEGPWLDRVRLRIGTRIAGLVDTTIVEYG